MNDYIIPPKNLEALAKKFGIGKYARKPEGKGSKSDDVDSVTQTFSIKKDNDFYIINGVRINDEVKTVKWTKNLLDKGKSHTQDEWVEKTKDGEVRLAALSTYIASIITLYDNRNVQDREQKDLVEEVRKMFENDFDPKKPWMITSTRIMYTSQGPDKIRHNYGYDDEYEINEEITGPNNWIKQGSGLEQATQAVLENDDLDKIEKAFEWMSTKKPYLWRFNAKPQKDEERAVVLGRSINSNRFYINCNDSIFDRPGRGVVVVNAKNSSSGNKG